MSIEISLCILSRAKPFKRVSPVEFRKYVLIRFNVEKLRSGVAIVIGKVALVFKMLKILGNIDLSQRFNASIKFRGLSFISIHLCFQSNASFLTVERFSGHFLPKTHIYSWIFSWKSARSICALVTLSKSLFLTNFHYVQHVWHYGTCWKILLRGFDVWVEKYPWRLFVSLTSNLKQFSWISRPVRTIHSGSR